MRADRLVAVLLLLQQRGQVTAAEVARELEVSERTARRDLDALGMAGVPVYATQGRGGGWRLAGGGTTDLTGLTAGEARALFLVAGPAAGATPELKAALRKLVGALPEAFRDRAEAASAAVVVDHTAWGRPGASPRPPPNLDAVQQAVVDRVQVELDYVSRTGEATSRTVHPLGVAAKGSTWYLFADTSAGLRSFRVDRIERVHPTGEPALRPPDFDLAETWERFVADVDRLRAPVPARARVTPDGVLRLRYLLGTRVVIGAAGADGRIDVELRGHHVEALAAELAGLGAALEVLEPPELRAALGRLGAELAATYA